MGIARGLIKLLMKEGNNEPFRGKILTIGRQDVFATAKHLDRWATEMGFQLKKTGKLEVADKKGFKEMVYLTDNSLFRLLGFDSVDSLDFSDYEKCTIVHDLNKEIPEALRDQFDLILDGGTSEHIFNFPKVLENYHKMLKIGGRLIHMLPSSNYIDHGFYMFSPTLLHDYYSANNWDIKDSFIIRHSIKADAKKWEIYDYKPGCLTPYSFGGFNSGLYITYFVAKKTNSSTYDASFQQGYYLDKWAKVSSGDKITHKNTAHLFAKKIKENLPVKLIHYLWSMKLQMLAMVPLRFRLKLIARY